MTDDELRTLNKRYLTFVDEGLHEYEADDLSYAMMIRDREGMDDRRVCFECTNYQNKLCDAIRDAKGKPTQPLRFMLQRCDYFKLKGAK
jgi:hypothetical protein